MLLGGYLPVLGVGGGMRYLRAIGTYAFGLALIAASNTACTWKSLAPRVCRAMLTAYLSYIILPKHESTAGVSLPC